MLTVRGEELRPRATRLRRLRRRRAPHHGSLRLAAPLLAIEREVVHALLDTADAEHRARVAAWVEGCLDDMPELLRAGVKAESLLVMAWHRVRGTDLRTVLDVMERNPIGLVQSYPRLFRSLVLFGDLELAVPAR